VIQSTVAAYEPFDKSNLSIFPIKRVNIE